jgi:hypothetical protein
MLSIVTTFWNALLKSFDAISTKPKFASVEIVLLSGKGNALMVNCTMLMNEN